MLEYALIAALVSLGIVASVQGVANSSTSSMNAISSQVQNAR